MSLILTATPIHQSILSYTHYIGAKVPIFMTNMMMQFHVNFDGMDCLWAQYYKPYHDRYRIEKDVLVRVRTNTPYAKRSATQKLY